MDIDGQHEAQHDGQREAVDPADPYGVRADAAATLEQHIRNSTTGLCSKCGRPWESDSLCGAPEVMNALGVLRTRPNFRMAGANRLGFAYDFR